MVIHESNSTKLLKRPKLYTTERQPNGTVHEFVCTGGIAAIRHVKLAPPPISDPFPPKYGTTAKNTRGRHYHPTTKPFLTTLYIPILGKANGLSKSIFVMMLLVSTGPIYGRNPTPASTKFCCIDQNTHIWCPFPRWTAFSHFYIDM